MENLEMKKFSHLLALCLFIRITHTNNVSSSDELRHPRVSGRIVKVYSGIKPEPILCPGEGFQADPIDCAVFYRCVKGTNDKYTVFRYQCGPGTVYDPDNEVCNHPKSTKRVNCGGYATFSTELINANEIDGPLKEIPSPFSTKQPIYSERTTKKRDTSTFSTSKSWFSSTDYKSSQSPIVTTSYPWMTTVNQHPKATNTPVSYEPNTETGEKCTSDGFLGDTENCRRFYRCVANGRGGYIRYEFSCSELTVWDDEAQACNHAWAVKKRRCGRGHSDDDNNEFSTPMEENQVNANKTIQSQIQISYGSQVNQLQTQISKGPVIQNQTQINYGDRLNKKPNSNIKQNQTQISHGSATSQTQTQIIHGNKGFQTQLQIDHSNKSSQTQTQVVETTTAQSSASPQHDVTQKPNNETPPSNENGNNKCTESGFMGDSNDCKKFYRCVDNGRGGYIKYEFSCGEGTVWDPNSEACNHAWAVKNCKMESSSPTMTQATKTSTTTKASTEYSTTIDTTTVDDEDVGYGIQNQQQTPISTTNKDKPLTSTESTSKTTVASSATIEVTNTIAADGSVCTSSGFMGDSADCKKFYRCVDNGNGGFTKYEYKCGEGTVWDSEIEGCNHAWAVKKCGGTSSAGSTEKTTVTNSVSITSLNPIQTTTELVEVDNDNGYGQPQENPTPTITLSTTTTQKPEVSNMDQSNDCTTSGFMGDKKDCKKFYRCVDNGNGVYTRYEFSCGEGTVWDSKLEACNHVWAVEKCGEKMPDQNTPETSTAQTIGILHDEEVDKTNEDKPSQSMTTNTIASTTTTSPPILLNDNICKVSGFIGDQNDCKKFYRCVDDSKGGYIRYDFSCGEGTVWDQNIEACNHPSADNNCKISETATQQAHNEITSQSSSTEQLASSTVSDLNGMSTKEPLTDKPTSPTGCSMEGFFGDTKDCKKFYRCVDNKQGGFTKYDFTCGEGTMWDSEINACNHVKTIKNGCSAPSHSLETTQKQPIQENDEYVGSSTSQTPTLETTAEFVTQKQESSLSDTCESEGFFANADDCKRFYRCVSDGKGGYIKYEFACGEGTIWDQQAQTCDHASSHTNCKQTSETSFTDRPQSQTETSTQSESSYESISTANTPATASTTSSSSDQCASEGFFGNSKDCKKFYRCVGDGKGGYTKHEFTCGEGTVWVQEIQACDHDRNMSNCSTQGGSTTTTPQGTQDVQSTTTAPLTTAQSTTPGRESDEMPSNNSDKCKSEGFHPNENDCKKFYRCVDNGQGGLTKYDFTCGDGTAWDSDIQSCNHINEVKNCQGSQDQNQSNPVMADENPSQPTETASNTKTSTTESPYETNQTLGNDKCEEEGYFGDSRNCQKFYRCVDNGKGGLTKYDYTCGEGTIWDQDILSCNHPRDVQKPSCNNNSTSTTTDSSNSASSSGTDSSSPSTESPQSSTSTESQSSSNCSQGSTQKPQNKNINCTKAGFYADPDDCKKFYRCVDWDNNGQRFSIYHFDCGEGTIWDPELETCNHEDSVYPPRDCSGTQNQGQNTTDESTTSTTTQKSTTVQSTSTTTEQSTTEDSTTESQTPITTTEPATTQQSTTTESTSTTNEQTTTQQSTTEQSTTQKSTTTEKSTTEQSSTTEKSTTEQSSTTEKSTTEQSSTTEKSTTEQLSTTEKSTTEQSSTTEKSTTEQSSTTEESTSKQPSTTEQNTTEQSNSTEQSTTEQVTTQQTDNTEQSTTQETNTTEQSTTEQSTTNDQSTTEMSSEQTTPQQSTTTEQTTTEQTTESLTEQTSNTEGTTTQESSTTETTDSTEQTSSSTTEQSSDSTTTENGQESTTETSSSESKECPETDDDQNIYVCPTSFRRHPKYCNMFYQCTEDSDSHDLKIAVFKCPNNTIYDESKTQCVEKDKADKKCDGEMAERRRVKRLGANFKDPIVVDKERHSCPATGYFPFEKSECSPAFLKCDKTKSGKLRGYVHQCPEGYVYWSISRRCEVKSTVRDCKLSANDWSDRREIPIERKNVAK